MTRVENKKSSLACQDDFIDASFLHLYTKDRNDGEDTTGLEEMYKIERETVGI